ncbi:rtxA repeat family protein, partial [Vibrio cholerae HC-72A2]
VDFRCRQRDDPRW